MNARSVMECGSPLPLFSRPRVAYVAESARGLAQSRTLRSFVAALSILGATLSASAQTFSLDWFTLDGGGGASTGGVYSVSGTIGQPDAGALAGDNFTLVGGFWSVVSAVQTPGAPLLSVEQTNGTVRIFWPLPATGFVLDETTALASPPGAIAWSQVAFPYQTNATHISITVPMPAGHKFYRLRKP